jgi:hypothetical protein
MVTCPGRCRKGMRRAAEPLAPWRGTGQGGRLPAGGAAQTPATDWIQERYAVTLVYAVFV